MSSDDRFVRKLEALIEPVAGSMGLGLVQVLYRRENSGWVLRILVEREAGVTIDDCKQLSHELSDLLDVEDPIPTAYRLEISSPGLDRPLVKPADFERFAGHRITLKTSRALYDRRNFTGKLIGIEANTVVLAADGTRYEIDHALIAKANLVPDIEGFPSRPNTGESDAVQS